jgi:hypothetical protein
MVLAISLAYPRGEEGGILLVQKGFLPAFVVLRGGGGVSTLWGFSIKAAMVMGWEPRLCVITPPVEGKGDG